MKIDWEKIEPCGKTTLGNDKKIYLEHLPKGGKQIKWSDCIGMEIYSLYDNMEYTIKIKDRLEDGTFIIDLVGDNYNEIGFAIARNNLYRCKIGRLIRNIYVNKTIPNRQLIIDSIGEEEAKKYTYSQGVKIPIKCPNCGLVTKVAIHNVVHHDFTCGYCTTGISYSERLMREVLNKLNIEYKMQYIIKGYSYRYDFYLPKFNAIIETHGEQHYVCDGERGMFGRPSNDKENDKNKMDTAVANGIKSCDYHQVDCRESNITWCRPYIIEALKHYSDIEKFDEDEWNDIAAKAERKYSSLVEVCKTYDENKETFTTVKDFQEKFFPELKRREVNGYLVKGEELGICTYRKTPHKKRRTEI